MIIVKTRALEFANIAKAAYEMDYNKKLMFAMNSCRKHDEKTGLKVLVKVDPTTREVVVGFAGTEMDPANIWGLEGIRDNISNISLAFNQSIPQVQVALKFLSQCAAHLGMQNTDKVVFTGHSLGAALAEISLAEAYKKGLTHYSAITFDSPGTKQYIEKNYGDSIVQAIEDRVTTVVYKANFINMFGYQLGTVAVLYQSSLNPITNFFASKIAPALKLLSGNFDAKEMVKQDIQNHSIDTIIKALHSYKDKQSLPIEKEWNDMPMVGKVADTLQEIESNNLASGLATILDVLHSISNGNTHAEL